MKRMIAGILLVVMLCGLAVIPAYAEGEDVVIDTQDAFFPADTTITGDLILTGDCPETVILINVQVLGRLLVETEQTVTVRLQGESSCTAVELNANTRLIGGTCGTITVNNPYTVLEDITAQTVDLAWEGGVLSAGGTIDTLTFSAENVFAGGTGYAEKAEVNASGCTVNLRCGEVLRHAGEEENPGQASVFSSVKASFLMNPTVSPAQSVINAKVTFSNVPDDLAGDYRIYWYIGDVLSYYEWNFTLEDGASSEMNCSAHFNTETDVLPVWVRLVNNADEDIELRFVSKVTCLGYSTAEYEELESTSHPYSIHLLRNQGVIIVYGLDEKGEYTKIVNVFACSVGYYKETSLGDFEIGLQMRWGALMADLYGQYCSQFNYNQLFHSVPYRTQQQNNIEFEEYPKLGEPASSGCVRLCTADAKWIYDHCSSGTPVHVYDTEECPVEKPLPALIREDSLNRGWDPTDPDSDNPTKPDDPPTLTSFQLDMGHPLSNLQRN